MNSQIIQWAIRNQVSQPAVAELRLIFGLESPQAFDAAGKPELTEAYSQSMVRLEAARKGLKLWRNNVGVLKDLAGRPVRYGLANDSKALNEVVKSSDLIGWKPVLITPEHVGSRIAQFISRECKKPGWRFTGDDHERAQLRWMEAVMADGGDAAFCTGEGSL
jgi:hypothetical protein